MQVKLLLLAAIAALALVTSVTAVGQDSCQGRCNKTGTDPKFDCQCNIPCITFGDCCDDYPSLCLGINPPSTCKGKCGSALDPSAPCQCNDSCERFGDCCPDYNAECGDGGETPGAVSDAEIIALTEALHTAENTNNAAQLVSIDLQGQTDSSSSQDKAPLPLLTVQAAALEKPTIKLLTALYDNYVADVGQNEDVRADEQAEENAFLDAVFATPVFQQLRAFMILKKFWTEANARTSFYDIWFGQYSRQSGRVGSSGFEHVFLGEIKSGVSGFHNWVFFNNEEVSGDMNYRGWIEYASFGEKGSLVAHNFLWRSNQKPISSMFVGTSPELELSVFTLCWYARPNKKCTIQFNGTKFYVQTYDITYNGKKFVASSYADVSP